MSHIQGLRKYKKEIAIDLRRRGNSLSEIENSIHVPKSTLSFWLKKEKLSEEVKKKLNEKRSLTAKKNSEKIKKRIDEEIEKIELSSSENIKDISKREFWLMGVMLYWKERLFKDNKYDIRNGLRYSSSDPAIISFFLKWLNEIGKIPEEEITFDLFLETNRKNLSYIDVSKKYWSKILKCHISKIEHIYFKKNYKKHSKEYHEASLKKNNERVLDGTQKRYPQKNEYGILRMRVKKSSLLARQISGWARGIKRTLKLD